jgi:hypothetical protein
MRGVRIGAVVAALGLVTGCTGGGSSAGHTAPTQTVLPAALADCPDLAPSGEHQGVAVDYVDFIQAFGQNYLAGFPNGYVTVRRQDLGRVALRSRCSLSALNDRTHKAPRQARDGDTAFLKAGTPIYALRGWSTRCRLTARSAGAFRVYLAQQPNASHATPRPCAVHH